MNKKRGNAHELAFFFFRFTHACCCRSFLEVTTKMSKASYPQGDFRLPMKKLDLAWRRRVQSYLPGEDSSTEESSSRGRSIAIWENKRKSHRNLRDYLTSHWTRHRDRLLPLLAQWSRGISALQSSHRIHPSQRFPQTPHRLCRKLPFLLLLKAEILTRAIRVTKNTR